MHQKAQYNGWKTVNNVATPDQLGDNELVECKDFHIANNGALISRLGWKDESLVELAWYQQLTSASTSGWSLSTDGAGLTTNTASYVMEITSLEFDKTGVTQAFVYAEKSLTEDWSQYTRMEFFTKPTANVTSYTVYIFSDNYNFYYDTFDYNPDSYGWQQIKFEFINASTYGSPSLAKITKVRIQYNFATISETASNIILNTIYTIISSRIIFGKRFSKSNGDYYDLAGANGDLWQKRKTASYNGYYIYDRIYTGFKIDAPISMDVYADILYLVCTESAMIKYDGTEVTIVGSNPPEPPGFGSFVTGGALTGTFYYAGAWKSSKYGHKSPFSILSTAITAVAQNINLILPGFSPDPQYDIYCLYRTSQATAENLYLIEEVAATITTYCDSKLVTQLSALDIAMNEQNYPPPIGATAIRFFKDRGLILGQDNSLMFSLNADPQSYSPYNSLTLTTELSDSPIGISPPLAGEEQLLIYTRNTTWLCRYLGGQGESTYQPDANSIILQPFMLTLIDSKVGCTANATIHRTSAGIIWQAEDGIYLFGTEGMKKISIWQGDNLKSENLSWFNNINKLYLDRAIACTNNDRYLISFPIYPSITNSITLEYNCITNSWSEFLLSLDCIFIKEDSNGYPVLYHSARSGFITYETGLTDNDIIINPSFKTKAYYWNVPITGRRIDLRTNATSNQVLFSQYFDLSDNAYIFPDGSSTSKYETSTPITEIPTTGKAKYIQHNFSFQQITDQVIVTGYNFTFDARYDE